MHASSRGHARNSGVTTMHQQHMLPTASASSYGHHCAALDAQLCIVKASMACVHRRQDAGAAPGWPSHCLVLYLTHTAEAC